MFIDLQLQNINVSFSYKTVLQNINIQFSHGKINMIIGENGAGKSTLAKIICGDIQPTDGKILINEKEVKFKSPKDAINKGIVCVHQRPLLANNISIYENLFLGAKKTDKNEIIKLIDEWLGIDKNTLVRDIGGDSRFFTSLIGALLKKPKLLILDEPTSLLDDKQRVFLFSKIQEFAKTDMNIIIITHNSIEANKYSDTITLLKKGNIISDKSEIENYPSDVNQIVYSNKEEKNSKNNNFFIKFSSINCRPKLKPLIFDVSFCANSGEITLISGLVESGRETLEDCISGMSDSKINGNILIQKNELFFTYNLSKNYTIRTLKKSGFNIAIIPSNKTYRASNPSLSILQLLTTSKDLLSEKENQKYADLLLKEADVNIKLTEKVSCLSGGMLQRLILSRELHSNPEIIILCEPLQGLDKTASASFCSKLLELANSDKIVIILSSSDFPEDICGKIYHLNNGYCLQVKG